LFTPPSQYCCEYKQTPCHFFIHQLHALTLMHLTFHRKVYKMHKQKTFTIQINFLYRKIESGISIVLIHLDDYLFPFLICNKVPLVSCHFLTLGNRFFSFVWIFFPRIFPHVDWGSLTLFYSPFFYMYSPWLKIFI